MLSTRDKVWNRNYRKLKAYIDEHHHLPDKKKVEHRGLLNWVKYNRKKIKAGTLSPEKERLFSDLLASRHAGQRHPELDSGPDPASRHAEQCHPGLRPGIDSASPVQWIGVSNYSITLEIYF